MGTIANNDNLFGTARFIVNPTAGLGTHTTIQAAITAASATDTIFVMPGQYTENLTLKTGVNLVGYVPENNVSKQTAIIGKLIDNGSIVTVNFSNITFQTNSDFILNLTAASVICLNNCWLNCLNNTGITSNSASLVIMSQCVSDLGTTGIGLYAGSVNLQINSSILNNTGASVTGSTTTGTVTINNTQIAIPLACTSTAFITANSSTFGTSAQNTTSITTAGTGVSLFNRCSFLSGSASALSIGSGTTVAVYESTIDSTNTNPVTGAGTYKSDHTSYVNTGILPNTTARTFAVVGEKASWTPVLAFGGASVGITYVAQTGSYTRIGNVVTFTCNVQLSSKGSSTGNVTITGLPAVGAGVPAATTIYAISANTLTFTGQVDARMPSASSSISIDNFASGGARAILTDAAFANDTFVQISGSYLV